MYITIYPIPTYRTMRYRMVIKDQRCLQINSAIRISVVLSYLVLLAPIVHEPNRGDNCKYEIGVKVKRLIMELTLREPRK
ncbi:hypothetical protein CY34DRAFT_812172 [Suillus luteus UH-Slu-Lm8-n1]|uniref:Uncharacterized protein n=1 Tax=Suillus luteus UH-Slu-Lm8-n1 TaxID=930992 RepID=A0A0D0A0U1_9AGAM|nr:hypothetical protein CY34DRAFT_812172 [Suillus luteus UH-Slu-Lm8-n1]